MGRSVLICPQHARLSGAIVAVQSWRVNVQMFRQFAAGLPYVEAA